MDCTKNPNDPVCLAYYGGSPDPANVVHTMVTDQSAIISTFQKNPVFGYHQATVPGSTVNTFTTPGQAVVIGPPSDNPWYKTWWGIGLLALGAGVGYFKVIKPRLNKAA